MPESPFEVTIKVGKVLHAEAFTEARTPELVKLRIDLGDDGVVRSAGQLGYHYAVDDLVGRQVLCATDLGTVRIAGFESEVLTVGVPGADGQPVLAVPDREVPLGGTLF